MSSNQTTNYQLPIWAAEDKFQREEFNEANQKLDNALAQVQQTLTQKADSTAVTAIQNTLSGKADNSTVAAMQNTLNGKADSTTVNTMQQTITQMQQTLSTERIVVGSYTGDGASGRTITLPFTPKLVILSGYCSSVGTIYDYFTITFGSCNFSIRSNSHGPEGNITLVTNGFTLSGNNHNISGKVEQYIAIS